MLDKSHVDVAGQRVNLTARSSSKVQPFLAPRGNGFVPHRSDFFPQ